MENDNVIKFNENCGFGFVVHHDGRHSAVLLTNVEDLANTWCSSFSSFGYKYTVKTPVLSNKKKYEVFTREDSITVLMEEVRLGIKKWEEKTDLRPSEVRYLEILRSVI
jgi:hypothetical protein